MGVAVTPRDNNNECVQGGSPFFLLRRSLMVRGGPLSLSWGGHVRPLDVQYIRRRLAPPPTRWSQ